MRKRTTNELQAVYIIWMRHMKRFVRTKGRVLGSVLQPLFFLLAFGMGVGRALTLGGGASAGASGGITYLQFLLCGLIGMSVIFASVMAGIAVIWDRQFGFLKEVLVAPVSRLSIVLGRTLGAVTTALIQACVIVLIAMMMRINLNLPGFISAVPFIIALSIFATGIGLTVSSRMQDMESFQFVQNIFIMPMVFLSTAFMPITLAPEWLRNILLINPVSYILDGIRHMLIGSGEIGLVYDAFVACIAATITFVLSAISFSRMEV